MKFSKEHIIHEIKRTAGENGGKPLGKGLFWKQTGIRESDWLGKYWVRWSAAVSEAGYKPNQFNQRYEDKFVIEQLAFFIKEIGHWPIYAEFCMKGRTLKTFPEYQSFRKKGSKEERALKVIEHCQKHSGFDDVIKICESISASFDEKDQAPIGEIKEEVLGYVYMTKVSLKNATSYKIGFSTSPYKRISQLNTRSPVEEVLIHEIETNDPSRSEQYWHKKHSDKRQPRTEYFNLRSTDIQLFKKYKSMMWRLIFTPPN
ncbi:MAG: hypothetical protein COV46_05880 [Deltaproteobacteria bacterium CG11_big_fil_rev_8_21_14_0_20_49_13]|nr:MAG: hypothetical protein COV46_05880 [Deltaproteobacteria bacterium CG11_big_fil_rev_8_21_14_0_20_49_13]